MIIETTKKKSIVEVIDIQEAQKQPERTEPEITTSSSVKEKEVIVFPRVKPNYKKTLEDNWLNIGKYFGKADLINFLKLGNAISKKSFGFIANEYTNSVNEINYKIANIMEVI
jgi:hypothetical protein